MCERENECVRERVCTCVCECVCVRESVCVCVTERGWRRRAKGEPGAPLGRERESERVSE